MTFKENLKAERKRVKVYKKSNKVRMDVVIGGKKMKQQVVISQDVKSKMQEIFPKDMSVDYFEAYEELVRQHVIKNKEKHKTSKGKDYKTKEDLEVIYCEFIDAILVRPQFLKLFSR